jgi:hypothetical protein
MIEGATRVVIVIAAPQVARWRTRAAGGEEAEEESGEPNKLI